MTLQMRPAIQTEPLRRLFTPLLSQESDGVDRERADRQGALDRFTNSTRSNISNIRRDRRSLAFAPARHAQSGIVARALRTSRSPPTPRALFVGVRALGSERSGDGLGRGVLAANRGIGFLEFRDFLTGETELTTEDRFHLGIPVAPRP